MCLGNKASTPLASASLSHRVKKVPERSRKEVRILVLWIILVSEKEKCAPLKSQKPLKKWKSPLQIGE